MNVTLNEYAWVKVKYGKPDVSSSTIRHITGPVDRNGMKNTTHHGSCR